MHSAAAPCTATGYQRCRMCGRAAPASVVPANHRPALPRVPYGMSASKRERHPVNSLLMGVSRKVGTYLQYPRTAHGTGLQSSGLSLSYYAQSLWTYRELIRCLSCKEQQVPRRRSGRHVAPALFGCT